MWHPKILIALVIVAEITFLGFTTSIQQANYITGYTAYYDGFNILEDANFSENIYVEEDLKVFPNSIVDTFEFKIYGSNQKYTDEQQEKIDAAMEEAKLFTKHLNLEGFYLKFVNLELIQDCIENRITQITLKNNYIQQFPTDLHQIPTLEALDLSYNQIEMIENIQFFDNLTTLNLAHNKLEQFPFGINELEHLTTLDFSNNNIPFIATSAINDLHRLRTIDISGNDWNQFTIKDWKRKLPNVEVISGE